MPRWLGHQEWPILQTNNLTDSNNLKPNFNVFHDDDKTTKIIQVINSINVSEGKP